MEPESSASAGEFFTTEPPGKPWPLDLQLMRRWKFCDNHFMMSVSQTVTLYALHLHAGCQRYLRETGRKKIRVLRGIPQVTVVSAWMAPAALEKLETGMRRPDGDLVSCEVGSEHGMVARAPVGVQWAAAPPRRPRLSPLGCFTVCPRQLHMQGPALCSSFKTSPASGAKCHRALVCPSPIWVCRQPQGRGLQPETKRVQGRVPPGRSEVF
ncbi:uncharacterized protein LOC132657795 isoform X2 [Ovis aries]|uniref:uncharacterized protein LOC132657795 isoform X2 n=1 Tax=Ovis aries TaxID=9940 RepID=UPI002952805D|nr:uncharacterized protein LOC132657795 isoform X2 [Ovis aries]XP_060255167.1 uncharacterized protein LOC132657795 isoform X2 [Ovis aries]